MAESINVPILPDTEYDDRPFQGYVNNLQGSTPKKNTTVEMRKKAEYHAKEHDSAYILSKSSKQKTNSGTDKITLKNRHGKSTSIESGVHSVPTLNYSKNARLSEEVRRRARNLK